MNKRQIRILGVAVGLISTAVLCQGGHALRRFDMITQAYADHAQEGDYNPLPGFGKKCPVGENYYFIYQFDKRPQIGTRILKVELFDKSGKRSTKFNIAGNSGMPAMKGAHDSGDQPFKLNKKGDYLLPVNIVMPGEWEVKLTFSEEKQVIYRGSFKFTV